MSKLFAVVPAAGAGQRMRSSTPKQYLGLADDPTDLAHCVLQCSLQLLLECSALERIIVALADEDDYWLSLPAASSARITTTIGGATRAHSVINGLETLAELGHPQDNDWVLVHDAARPCLTAKTLSRLIDSLRDDPVGGILAVPVSDTLKRQHADDTSIAQTIDRRGIWQAQTPQMFRFGLLRNALRNALREDIAITDEASAMESAGHRVQLVNGETRNLKVTTPEDLEIARMWRNLDA